MKQDYRPEIDGLRALAVTSVILFHAGVPGFKNGFIGVDIFFVISGFLITSIILREQKSSDFSYRKFVTRRVRRILPALITVMVFCIPFSIWLMLPDPLENFGQSLVATVLSSNNILLWLTTGYWDLSSEYKPLLHTWSLAVEEQFYLIYPILLVWALRLPPQLLAITILSASIVSYTAMTAKMETNPNSAFYLFQYRAWQLLLGGLAAILKERFRTKPNSAVSVTGLAMIIGSLTLTALPLESVLLFVSIGTMVFLLYTESSMTHSRLFTCRPIVFIGLISYSLYLWHQPILALIRIESFHPPEPLKIAIGISITALLSTLSWKYIETPFRSEKSVSSRTLWQFVSIGCVICLTTGLALHLSKGIPKRLGQSNERVAAGASISYNERIREILPNRVPENNAAKKPIIVISGNSFARDFANTLLEADLSEELYLVYRHDLSICSEKWDGNDVQLVASASMMIFTAESTSNCRTEVSEHLSVPKFYVGVKHFGHNLNPLVRMTPSERKAFNAVVPDDIHKLHQAQKLRFGDQYIDIIGALSTDEGKTIRVTTEEGILLTTDRVHLSQAGAMYLAEKLPSIFPEIYTLVEQTR